MVEQVEVVVQVAMMLTARLLEEQVELGGLIHRGAVELLELPVAVLLEQEHPMRSVAEMVVEVEVQKPILVTVEQEEQVECQEEEGEEGEEVQLPVERAAPEAEAK